MPNTLIATLTKKTKIFLGDYAYKRDIENRLFLSDLSVLEVEVLQEILNSSIKIPLSDLCKALNCKTDVLLPILDKFSRTGLLMRQNDSIFVDKEQRKYYEFNIQKFDDEFEPNIDFLQGMLNKVPIPVLPIWYNISKTSDNIFVSLIEKYFQTPKIYEKHLNDLTFPDPIFGAIIRDVFASPDLKVFADDIRNKYSLSKEKFEELILQLEFHLACCMSYNKINGKWKEVITPFHEWREFLQFQTQTKPKPIADKEAIERTSAKDEFSFLFDLQVYLKELNSGKPVKQLNPAIERSAILLGFAELSRNKPIQKDSPEAFLSMPIQDQSMLLYRQELAGFIKQEIASIESAERSSREVEKSLKRVLSSGWILFEDFMKGFIAQVGSVDPVTIKKMGKKWNYALPRYSEEEKKFIEMMIFGPLYHAGLTTTGTYKGKRCFAITAYGKIALGD